MINLLMLAVWPTLISREPLGEPVQIAGLSVQSWFVYEPSDRVQQQLVQADCLVLPVTSTTSWQCLTNEVMYTWDYSVQPSIWSESRRLEEQTQQHISWNGVHMSVDVNRTPLYQLYHQTRQQARSEGAQVYLNQQFQKAFVWAWWQRGLDITVTGWQDEEGISHLLRVERNRQP
ncbi:hypothetical protein CWE15_01635 [Aliidiomarina taiwanensis]|uniref:Uncharacterized protein n=1 Tax=Aliidiomarina taiwanensis TaxID=946228 RepID=A0A432X938_9GAMM|nr:hypothetical protein [Aliidiomarina taiwanensis]RUO43912.1 hypothetical protein CWE15_01635 [Aliidiomarina taiwanensis]